MKNNEVCFNELSVFPLCKDEKEAENRVKQFFDTLKVLYDRSGIKKVRYHEHFSTLQLSEQMTILQYCQTHRNDILTRLFLSTFTMPQLDEKNEADLEKYCETQVEIHKGEAFVKTHGFNAAYCQGIYCIGFQPEDFWSRCIFRITVKCGAESKETDWACLSHPTHPLCQEFKDWYDATLRPIELIECLLSYEEKIASHIHLREDHGKDVLEHHAKRLLHNKYVKEVINSLRFNPNATRYIFQIKENGIINIVLHWTDKGYGMAIQTTGRNIQETQAIAQIIEKEYGNK